MPRILYCQSETVLNLFKMGIISHQCKSSFVFVVLCITVISTSIRPSDCVRRNSKSRDFNQLRDNNTSSTISDVQSAGTRRSSKFSADLHSPLLPLSPQDREMIVQPTASSKTRRRSRDRVVVNNSTGKSTTGKSGQAKVMYLLCFR